MTFEFNKAFPDATNEQKWEQIRLWRNDELKATDWTQIPDAVVDKEAFAKYRQELRDLPTKYNLANNVILPEKPSA